MMGASTRTRSAAVDRNAPASDRTRKANRSTHDTNAAKGKVVRRDPAKRREQNRQSQKTYREKQRKRIEDLERRAAAAGDHTVTYSMPGEAPSQPTGGPYESSAGEGSNQAIQSITDVDDVIDPSILQSSSTDMLSGFDISSFLPLEFDQWLLQDTLSHQENANHDHNHHNDKGLGSNTDGSNRGTPTIYFDCGCPALHIPMPFSPLLLPITPLLNPYINAMRLDVECTLDALLRNCLHLGIAKAQFCADEAESHFYRPLLPSPNTNSNTNSYSSTASSGSPDSEEESHDTNLPIQPNGPIQRNNKPNEYTIPNEASTLLTRTHRIFRTLKHDLRPLDTQITTPHHPYIDVLPFRDVRANLIRLSTQGVIDEDEFLHDFFNHARCWGGPPKMGRLGGRGGKGSSSVGVGGSTVGSGSGSPWSARSWEVSDEFLWKWSEVVGGEDGELARSSMWWKSMRGEVLDEI